MVPPNWYYAAQWDTITSVEFDRVGEYYDLHVPAAEHYLAEGIWHHNTGKSRACLEKLHACCLRWPGTRALICRKTRESLTESALVTFEEKVLPEGSPIATGPQRRMRQAYHYPNASEAVVGGLDKPGKVMSTEYDIIYVQEAIELSENDLESLTTRLRNGVMPFQQLEGDTNPEGPQHWLRRRADSGATAMLESRHEDNPVIWDMVRGCPTPFGADYLARLDRLTGVRYQRLRLGRWAAAEGLVYEGWDRAVHLVDGPRFPATRHVAGVDWGFTNPGVIQVWAVDYDGRMTLVREVCRTQKLIGWWVAQAAELRDRYRIEAFACDPAEPAFIEQFARAKIPAVKAYNDIAPGVQAVQARIAVAGDGLPRLTIARDALAERDEAMAEARMPCGAAQEIEEYAWPRGGDGKALKEIPVDKYNHSMDAMRYAVCYADNLPPRPDRAIRRAGPLLPNYRG